MKKALALVMAVAMVMSLAAVSFAVTDLRPVVKTEPTADTVKAYMGPYKYNSTTKNMHDITKVPYGTTVYYALATPSGVASEAKSVSDLKVSAVWDEGASYVSGVEIVKKTANGFGKAYFLAVSTTGTEVKTKDVIGEVTFKGRSGDAKTKIESILDVEFQLGYDAGDVANIGEDLMVYNLNAGLNADNEKVVNFGGKFDVTVKRADKETAILLACDEDVIEEVDEAYPDASIDYYALTGAFKKTATVVVELEEGEEYLYEVVDGVVVEVDGEYDDWAEEFTFKARKLGTYIISDVELDVAADVVATNPSTGAAA